MCLIDVKIRAVVLQEDSKRDDSPIENVWCIEFAVFSTAPSFEYLLHICEMNQWWKSCEQNMQNSKIVENFY